MFRKKLFPRQASILGTKDWSLIGGHEFRCDSTQQILLLVRPVQIQRRLKTAENCEAVDFCSFRSQAVFQGQKMFQFLLLLLLYF